MRKLIPIEIINLLHNIYGFLESYSICQQTYRSHIYKILRFDAKYETNSYSITSLDVNLRPSNWFLKTSYNSVKQVIIMDCGIVVCEFVLQSIYYVHFRANTLGKGMNTLILLAMG